MKKIKCYRKYWQAQAVQTAHTFKDYSIPNER